MQWVVIVRQVRKAREESPNKGAFIVKLCEILCGSGMPTKQLHACLWIHDHQYRYNLHSTTTAACFLCMLIFAALPITAVVIGKSTVTVLLHTVKRGGLL